MLAKSSSICSSMARCRPVDSWEAHLSSIDFHAVTCSTECAESTPLAALTLIDCACGIHPSVEIQGRTLMMQHSIPWSPNIWLTLLYWFARYFARPDIFWRFQNRTASVRQSSRPKIQINRHGINYQQNVRCNFYWVAIADISATIPECCTNLGQLYQQCISLLKYDANSSLPAIVIYFVLCPNLER